MGERLAEAFELAAALLGKGHHRCCASRAGERCDCYAGERLDYQLARGLVEAERRLAHAERWPPDWYWHELHGLHDLTHHHRHPALHLCVPLNDAHPPSRRDPLRAEPAKEEA